jgi:molybdenum cofactor guanylyltransferase
MSSRPPAPVTGLVLAGGRALRMGGVDKGMQLFRGRPLIEHVIERFQPQLDGAQSGDLLISGPAGYAAYGRVVTDSLGAGPLAGIHAALGACDGELLAVVPCDAPLLPLDLVTQLHASLGEADVAVARDADRLHFVFALLRRSLLPRLEAFLSQGGRSVERWYATLLTANVTFDDAHAFTNVNTLETLRALECP